MRENELNYWRIFFLIITSLGIPVIHFEHTAMWRTFCYIRQKIVFYISWIIICLFDIIAGTSNTTATVDKSRAGESHHYQKDDKSFPTWLIGVIILTSIGFIILVATIVQKLLRQRDERHEQYVMGR